MQDSVYERGHRLVVEEVRRETRAAVAPDQGETAMTRGRLRRLAYTGAAGRN
jgi:hypothetical protein